MKELADKLVKAAEQALDENIRNPHDARAVTVAVLRELAKERPHGGTHLLCRTEFDLLRLAENIEGEQAVTGD